MAIVLKIKYGDDTRRISYDKPPSYQELTQIVKQLFHISVVHIKYEDDDKDKITVTSQMELTEAYLLASRLFNNILRLFISETPVHSMEMNFLMKFLSSINLGVPSFAPAEVVSSPAVQEVLSRLGLSSSSPSSAPSSPSLHPSSVSSVDEPAPASTTEAEPVTHKGVTCDGCKTSDFTGTRYKCNVCINYDLCETCKAKGNEIHPITHEMISISSPITYFQRRAHMFRTPIPPRVKPSATFIGAVNYEDEKASPGEKVTKTWRVRNDGLFVWPVGTVLIHIGGSSDIPAEKKSMLIPLAAPGEQIDISLDLTMPVGQTHFDSFWRLSTANGERFGKRMRACFYLNTPSPTHTPVHSTNPTAAATATITHPDRSLPVSVPIPTFRPRFRPLFTPLSRQQAITMSMNAQHQQQKLRKNMEEEAAIQAKEEEEAAKAVAEKLRKEEEEEANKLIQLAEIGCTGDLAGVLRKHGGDVNAAAYELMSY